jgi:leader peptidase (prepilin peptidase) / N-methyltransferase
MIARRLLSAAAGAVTLTLSALLLHLDAFAVMRLGLLGAALGALVESDLTQWRIPNQIVAPAAAACAALTVAAGTAPSALVEGLLVVAALLALSLIHPEALGMGDVKLALLLVLGLDGRGPPALLIALALAAGFGLLLIARHGRAAGSRHLPLAPFFAAGTLLALLT